MDALEFLKARLRMCSRQLTCEGCPAEGINCGYDADATDAEYEKLIQIVDDWSREHPPKTRQDAFLEVWPNASMDGVVLFCPKTLDSTYSPIRGCVLGACSDCRRDFWMQEVE